MNKSKNDTPLKEWLDASDNPLTPADLLIPPDTSLDFRDVRSFLEARKGLLLERIKKNIVMSG